MQHRVHDVVAEAVLGIANVFLPYYDHKRSMQLVSVIFMKCISVTKLLQCVCRSRDDGVSIPLPTTQDPLPPNSLAHHRRDRADCASASCYHSRSHHRPDDGASTTSLRFRINTPVLLEFLVDPSAPNCNSYEAKLGDHYC